MNKILYKYFPPERSGFFKKDNEAEIIKGFFPNNTVSFTSPTEFNDPFDCEPNLSATPQTYLQYLKSLNAYEDIKRSRERKGLSTKLQDIKKEIKVSKQSISGNVNKQKFIEKQRIAWQLSTKNKVRILCLSKKNDNILMWSHYAENHTGFVVGIDVEYFKEEEKSVKNNGWGLNEVIYKINKPTVNAYNDNDIPDILPFYYKSPLWGYEEEVRFVGYYEDSTTKYLLKEIPSSYIKEIYFGVNINQNIKKEIINHCKENSYNLKLFQTFAAEDKYLLDIKPCL